MCGRAKVIRDFLSTTGGVGLWAHSWFSIERAGGDGLTLRSFLSFPKYPTTNNLELNHWGCACLVQAIVGSTGNHRGRQIVNYNSLKYYRKAFIQLTPLSNFLL